MASSRKEDLQHLTLLSIFHYILGGIIALCACFPVLYLFMGVMFVAMPPSNGAQAPPAAIGWLFILISLGLIVLGWSYAACVIAGGWFLSKKRHHTFCLVVAGMLCLFAPKGTVLGVFTFIVLLRPSVKQLFETGSTAEDGELLPEVEEPRIRHPSHDVRVSNHDY